MDDFDYPSGFLRKHVIVQQLRSIKLLKKRFNNDVAILGRVMGPWSLAESCYGTEKLLLDIILEPEKVISFLSALADLAVNFSKAQFDAGADAVVWVDHVTPDLFSAQIYREIVFPVHKRAVARLHTYGPTIFRTGGNVLDRLKILSQVGFRNIHLNSNNDMSLAVKLCGNATTITGGINNPFTIAQGTPTEIVHEVAHNIQCGVRCISPETAVSLKTSNKNLIELTRAAHRTPLQLQ